MFLIALLFSVQASVACVLPVQPERVESTEHAEAQVWNLKSAALLGETGLPVSSAYSAFRQWVAAHGIDSDPRALLRRQREIYVQAGFPEELPLFDRILDGQIGQIGNISCLEALLLDAHLARFPMWMVGTEFQAMILERPESGEIRVYFVSADQDGAAPALDLFSDRMKADLSTGWIARTHLHNHPFSFHTDPQLDIGGTTIPSDPDADAYLWHQSVLGLREARITNGLSTIVIPASQFGEMVRKRTK